MTNRPPAGIEGRRGERDNERPTLVVVAGPTGAGKSDLAIELAQHFDTEIVSADSRQVFRDLPIGTAQPTAEQLAAVPHHFIATEELTTPYTCGLYREQALAALGDIFARRNIAIAAGGSGLYIDVLCNGMDDIPQVDPAVREALNRRLADGGLAPLLKELRERDPAYHARVDRNNPQRVVRALEVCIGTGRPYSGFRRDGGTKRVKAGAENGTASACAAQAAKRPGRDARSPQPATATSAGRDFYIIKIGLLLERAELYARIDRRVDAMMAAGLEAEAHAVYHLRHLNALRTVGYSEMFDYFDGLITRERAVELIKQNSRRYAKRQLTWFNRDTEITWFDPRDTATIIRHIENNLRQ